MFDVRAAAFFVLMALAEIVGRYLPYVWLRERRSVWLPPPAAVSLALFAWLLTPHPTASCRAYTAYGGVYVAVATLWLWRVDGVRPTITDLAGVGLCLVGTAVILTGARLMFGEAGLAGAASEHPPRLARAMTMTHREISGVSLAVLGAVGIQAAGPREVVHGRALSGISRRVGGLRDPSLDNPIIDPAQQNADTR